jgi:hypothetical protein
MTQKSVTLSVKADTIVEASEYISVRLANASMGVQLGTPSATNVTIISSNGNTTRTCNSKNFSSGAPTGSGGGGALNWLCFFCIPLALLRVIFAQSLIQIKTGKL